MISQEIKTIIASFDKAKADYKWAYEQVGRYDQETQDILHSLELDPLTKNERNKIATRLKKVRITRRENKDVVEINEPIVMFLDSEKGRQMINLLREALGKTRKIEEYHQKRAYHKRIK